MVVLDNTSAHHSKGIKATQPERKVLGIHLGYLPIYSPELNASERVFRRVQAPGHALPHLHRHQSVDGRCGPRLPAGQSTTDTSKLIGTIRLVVSCQPPG